MTYEDTPMPNAPLTPGEDAELTSPSIDFSPSTVPYNEVFENELMNTILHPPTHISPRQSTHDDPIIPASQLPIPLSSNTRTHPSPIPGLFVTHPKGYHTGGPGPSPVTVQKFADDFIRSHGIEDAGQLERVVEALMEEKMAGIKARMAEREKMVERNKGINEELEKLRLQRDAEVRVLEKMKGLKR